MHVTVHRGPAGQSAAAGRSGSARANGGRSTTHTLWAMLVPAHIASYALGRDLVADELVRVGRKLELDTSVLGAERVACEAHWEATRRLWSDLESGTATGTAYAVLRRTVVDVAQRDGRGSGGARTDVRPQLEALELVPGVGVLIDGLLGAEPDHSALGAAARATGGTYDRADEHTTKVVVVSAGRHWPSLLGGSALPGELIRWVRVEANHRAWREHRVRRCVRLQVDIDEAVAQRAAA
jgi:hypothetical protein